MKSVRHREVLTPEKEKFYEQIILQKNPGSETDVAVCGGYSSRHFGACGHLALSPSALRRSGKSQQAHYFCPGPVVDTPRHHPDVPGGQQPSVSQYGAEQCDYFDPGRIFRLGLRHRRQLDSRFALLFLRSPVRCRKARFYERKTFRESAEIFAQRRHRRRGRRPDDTHCPLCGREYRGRIDRSSVSRLSDRHLHRPSSGNPDFGHFRGTAGKRDRRPFRGKYHDPAGSGAAGNCIDLGSQAVCTQTHRKR